MRLNARGRALWLALFLTFTTAGFANAHALPGSILTFSQTNEHLALTITLPIEDLGIADARFDQLRVTPVQTPLSPALTEVLADYFGAHLTLEQDGSVLQYTIETAILEPTFDEHLGHFTNVVVSFTLEARNSTTPMALVYDAVMHEVRNHRAIVIWPATDGAARLIADFGYNPIDGVQQPVQIARPTP